MTLVFTFSSCEIEYYENDDVVVVPQDREYIIGHYLADEFCEHDEYYYDIFIGRGSRYEEIFFGGDGLFETGFRVKGYVEGDFIDIPVQRFRDPTDNHVFYEFYGYAEVYDDVIYMEYEVLIVDHGVIVFEDYCDTHLYWDY